MKPGPLGRRYWINLFAFTVFAFVFAIAGLFLSACYLQTQVFLHPGRWTPTGNLLKANNIQYQEVELITKDGVHLAVWYTPPQNGAVILIAHGYGGARLENYSLLFAQHGYGVLSWDFRAHGASGGNFSTLGYVEQLDVQAALDYALVQPGVKHVGAWGGSLGAATLILTAAERPEIEAVVSDSGYPALEDVIRINVPNKTMLPFVMSLWELSSGAKINAVRPVDVIGRISPRAVFIIDGWEDGAIELNAPYRLYDAAREPKQLWVENGVPHLNMYPMCREQYTQKVIGFFDKYLLRK